MALIGNQRASKLVMIQAFFAEIAYPAFGSDLPGQRAMAVAMMFPEPAKLKRAGSLKIKNQDINAGYLSQARTVQGLTALYGKAYSGITTTNSGYRTRQTRGFFMPERQATASLSIWRDDRPEYNTVRGNTASHLFVAVESRRPSCNGGILLNEQEADYVS